MKRYDTKVNPFTYRPLLACDFTDKMWCLCCTGDGECSRWAVWVRRKRKYRWACTALVHRLWAKLVGWMGRLCQAVVSSGVPATNRVFHVD